MEPAKTISPGTRVVSRRLRSEAPAATVLRLRRTPEPGNADGVAGCQGERRKVKGVVCAAGMYGNERVHSAAFTRVRGS